MTETQANTIIDLLNTNIQYLEAMNQIMIGYQPFMLFCSIIISIVGGFYIGSKWGK